MIESIAKDIYETGRDRIPMRRYVEPAEMAAAVAVLASEEAGYITGIVFRSTVDWRCSRRSSEESRP